MIKDLTPDSGMDTITGISSLRFSTRSWTRSHRITWCLWLSVFSYMLTHAAVHAEFPDAPQCAKFGAKVNIKSLNFCLMRNTALHTMFPDSICYTDRQVVVITGIELLVPKPSTIAYNGMKCSSQNVDPFTYESTFNSTCLQQHGFSRQTKNAAMPLMRMYNGRSLQEIRKVDTFEFHHNMGPHGVQLRPFTWIKLNTRCVERRSTARLLFADICSNMEQQGASTVHVQFMPQMGSYVNQSSCSCNIFSGPKDPAVESALSLRALDIRFGEVPARLHLKGSDGTSRVLDGSEFLYWESDGELFKTREQLYLKLDKLSLERMPDRVWLEVRGTNLTVNCGPSNEPGGHQPLAGDSGGLGIGFILAIIIGLIILLALVILVAMYVFRRKRRRGSRKGSDDDYDISMGSHEDIRDRPYLKPLRHQMSTDSGPEPAVEVKTEAEVMCANPRMLSAPVPASDESQKALLQNENENADEPDIAKMPMYTPPPPPPHDPHHHEFFLCRGLSYIDDDVENLPPPPPLAYHPEEDVYSHLNEQQRPDVVPGNIYDTKPEEDHYSTPQKYKGANGLADGRSVVT